MSDSIVMQALEHTEISWVAGPGSGGLMVTQADSLGNENGSVWIPSDHVPKFIAAIQRAYAKR